jgi:hypothetical protein
MIIPIVVGSILAVVAVVIGASLFAYLRHYHRQRSSDLNLQSMGDIQMSHHNYAVDIERQHTMRLKN